MTTNTQTLLEKEAAAREASDAYYAALNRLPALEVIERNAVRETQRLTDALHKLRNTTFGASKCDSDAYEAAIAEQVAIREAAFAEKPLIESSLQKLRQEADARTRAVSATLAMQKAGELSAASAAWLEAVKPLLPVAERLRKALAAAGKPCALPIDLTAVGA